MRPWYLQSTFSDHGQSLLVVEALDRAGIPHTDAPILPFQELLTWPESDDYIVYGSNKLVQYAFNQNRPGVFFDPDTFNVRAWNKNHPDMLNADALYLTAGLLRNNASDYANAFKESGAFVRPLHDLKPFQSRVLDACDLADPNTHVFGNYTVPDDEELIMLAPKRIISELRCFVVGGSIQSISQYQSYGRLILKRVEDNSEEHWIAQVLCQKWLPHENCVMDLALTEDGWKVLEFNCINCSGFYDHDIEKVAVALSTQ